MKKIMLSLLYILPFSFLFSSCSNSNGMITTTNTKESSEVNNEEQIKKSKENEEKQETFTATFYNGGKFFDSLELVYGSVVNKETFADKIPTYQNDTSDGNYTYEFIGWNTTRQDNDIGKAASYSIKKDMTFYAVYSRTATQYFIKFLDWDGSDLYQNYFDYNTRPKFEHADPKRDDEQINGQNISYVFAGWSTNQYAKLEQAILTSNLPLVNDAATYYAIYNKVVTKIKSKYLIKFCDEYVVPAKVTELESNEVEEGKIPVCSITPTAGPRESAGSIIYFTFIGWTNEKLSQANANTRTKLESLPAVTGIATYYALYTVTKSV